MGYPSDVLSTRAVVKHGCYAVIPPTGLVNNIVPGLETCKVSIIASKKMGASFNQYIVEIPENCGTTKLFGCHPNVESFIFVINGEGTFTVAGKQYKACEGAYVYVPAGVSLEFRNTSKETMKVLLYKQIYIPLEGESCPDVFYGDVNNIPYKEYDDMANVFIKDLLPIDIRFDMNMHILSFSPGGCHPFVETHVQEHGAYVLEGEGCYFLDDNWSLIKQGDFIWFGPYVAQAAYGVGRGPFTYIYSKDCNRDADL